MWRALLFLIFNLFFSPSKLLFITQAASWDDSDDDKPPSNDRKASLQSPPRHVRKNSWDNDSDEEIDIRQTDELKAPHGVAAPPKAQGGWGDSSVPSGKSPKFGRRRGGNDTSSSSSQPSRGGFAADNDEPEKKTRSKWDSDDVVMDIATIPDLEEEGEENITRTVADAPNVRDSRVQSIRELDREIMFRMPTSSVSTFV